MNEKPRIPRRRFFGWLALGAVALFIAFLVGYSLDEGVTGYLLATIIAIFASAIVWLGYLLLERLNRWISLRWQLILLGCFIVFVAFFYAEENWRGKRAWENYKRRQEAKGEKFTLAELAPPPVPDNQNFALMPIVASSYQWLIDGHGRKLPSDMNVVNRLEMPIFAERDWPTNTGSIWQKAEPTNLKAYQEYYRALAAKTNLFTVATQPQSPAADVLLALSRYDSAIEELRVASRLPFSRFPLEYDSEDPAEILLPHLGYLKNCVQTLKLRASAELQLGQTDQALADVKLALYLANSIRNEPLLINHLVCIATFQLALNPIWEGLAEHRWSDAQLSELQREFARLDFFADYQLAMRGERAYGLGIIEYVRRHPRNGGWYFEGPGFLDDVEPFGESFGSVIIRLLPNSFFYYNQLTLARMYDDYAFPAINATNRIILPGQNEQKGKAMFHQLERQTFSKFFTEMLLPALSKAATKSAYAQSTSDLARVAIALERYRLKHGDFPESLAALAPQFIAQVPHDVIGGRPLHYHRIEDGQFVLYSIGWNEKDDGGIAGLRPSGSLDIETGDWVWRYPVK